MHVLLIDYQPADLLISDLFIDGVTILSPLEKLSNGRCIDSEIFLVN